MKDLCEPRIIRIDDFSDATERFGVIVRRVMNVVGADIVAFCEIDGYLSMSLRKKPVDGDNVPTPTVVFGPLFSPSMVESLSDMCRMFIEVNFLDTDNGNKLFSEMYGFNVAVDALKKKDRFGLLSKSFSELEIKLSLQGA